MIRLYQFAPAFGLPNASPFCMKLETYLRMAGLPYELVNSGDVLRAPKGKLPFIDDGGTRLADTSFIIEYLKGRYGEPLDASLTPAQRTVACDPRCAGDVVTPHITLAGRLDQGG